MARANTRRESGTAVNDSKGLTKAAWVFGCLGLLCGPGWGEPPPQRACPKLEPGQALRLDRVREGAFVSCSAAGLVLQDRSGRAVLPLAEIGRLETKKPRRSSRDFFVAGAGGFAAAFVRHRRGTCFCSPLTHTVLSGLKSLGPGAGVGVLYALARSAYGALKGGNWQAIDLAETKGEQSDTPNP